MISERNLTPKAEQQLRELLAPLPLVLERADAERGGIDLALDLREGDRRWTLVCELKSSGEPRFIRGAALQARELAQRLGAAAPRQGGSYPADDVAAPAAYPVVMAPFISAASGAICRELGVGYADLAGNCRLAFGGVYVEKSVAANPFLVKREQRSLFAPKSARVLRIMLGVPSREWKVAELAERAGISYGQVSKLRQALLNREWASGRWGGVQLAQPKALLAAWREAYAPMRTARNRYYTLLHGDALQNVIRQVLQAPKMDSALQGKQARHVLLSSYSAARWLAPYARVAGEYFYADSAGEARLKALLRLEPAAKGENIIIDLASDEGVFQEDIEAAPGLHCTGLIQTYLDLAAAGERGGDAAQHLFDERIAPSWKAGS